MGLNNDLLIDPPKRAVINTASSGDQTIVAAAGAGNKIVVLNYMLRAANAQTLTWKSGAGTSLTGAMAMATSDLGIFAQDSKVGVLETAANQALVLNLSAATQVSGHLTYVVIGANTT